MNPRVVAIVQARMGSARFPAKMLAKLGGCPLLEWVLNRVLLAERLDAVVLATSNHPRDEALGELARTLGVEVFCGDEDDVLGRFDLAASHARADVVVRVCADNPFVAPEEIDRLVRFFSGSGADYAFNHLDRMGSHYADGFGAEIILSDVLFDISRKVRDPRHREHVTSYVWEHPDDFRIAAIPAPRLLAHPELRFDVDTPEDLEFLEKLVASGVSLQTPAAEIVQLALATSVATGNPKEANRTGDRHG